MNLAANNLNENILMLNRVENESKKLIHYENFIEFLMHDLKTPIRANIQILELVLKRKFGKLDGELESIMDELLNSCKFMKYMTDNLIKRYKNEMEMNKLNKEKCSLENLIREKCNELTDITEHKNQTIEYTINGKISDIEIDKEEIGSVITNLIINASEQSIHGAKIKILIEENKENINVSVSDYGYPRNSANPDEIFEEDYIKNNRLRKVGFSIELNNCRKIIEAHNGRINAQNIENEGNRIIFSLPVQS